MSFNHLCREEVNVIHRMVAYQQAGLCSIFQHNQDTAIHHKVDICTKNIHQLNRLVYDYPFGDVEHEAILCKSCIEGSYSILGSIGQLTIILLYQCRMLFGQFFQAA